MVGTFGKRLRDIRTKRQILQSDFAARCEISSAYLSDIERGKRNPPNDETILKWARLLGGPDPDEISDKLVSAAAADRARAQPVAETVTEPAFAGWSSAPTLSRSTKATKSETPFLDYFQFDLTEAGRLDQLDPSPGRNDVIQAIAAVLLQRNRNSVLLVGETGDIRGIVQALAVALASKEVPDALEGKRFLRLDGLQAGTKYRGQLEERIHMAIKETSQIGDVLLHFHSLADLVDLEKSVNGSYIRPALEDGSIQIITGVSDELDYCERLNPRLTACFTRLPIPELDRDTVLRNLYEVRGRYETQHGVSYTEESVVAIVDSLVEGASIWQQALHKIDSVGAKMRAQGRSGEVTVANIDSCN